MWCETMTDFNTCHLAPLFGITTQSPDQSQLDGILRPNHLPEFEDECWERYAGKSNKAQHTVSPAKTQSSVPDDGGVSKCLNRDGFF